MDDWDKSYREPTEDERSARRALALAIALINARVPLSTTRIRRDFYEGMSDASFRKTFQRDRRRLVMAGLCLRNGPKDADIATWELDEESSFVKENLLTQQDALTLDFLLLPLASDPSYPYARDLRLALNKIDRSFDGTSAAQIPPAARERNNNISRLEDCMSASHAAQVAYRRADGTETTRVLAPYGFFFLRSNSYMVAARMGEDDRGEPPHTYNLDRVLSVRELPRVGYTLPADFDVRDYIRFPFQMGNRLYDAEFILEDGSVLNTYVCDEELAVVWAVAEGMRPVSPASLVLAWRRHLEAFVKGA